MNLEGAIMSDQRRDWSKYEEAYAEIARRDFEQMIYKRCDEEDAAKLEAEDKTR